MAAENTTALDDRWLARLHEEINECIAIGTIESKRILPARHRHLLNILTQLDSWTVANLCKLTKIFNSLQAVPSDNEKEHANGGLWSTAAGAKFIQFNEGDTDQLLTVRLYRVAV